jgi:flagellar biosynthesis GTPase FlhF
MLDLSNYLYGFAALLTLLATFGVIYFGRVVSKVKDAQVQQYQKDADVRIASSNQHAAEATQQAAESNAKSAEAGAIAESAKAEAATARAQAERARADAASANAEAEKSKTERAALQLRVQELTKSNVEQQQQIAVLRENDRPRVVLPQQRAVISAALTAHAGESINIQIFAQEGEALTYANQIIESLTSAGLKVGSSIMMGGTGTGLGFTLHSQNDQPPLALAIANAFRTAGIPYGVQVKPETAEHSFAIFIGSKPRIPN